MSQEHKGASPRPPVFVKKKNKRRRQVRFFSSDEAYTEFTAECRRQGLFIHDAFTSLMEWFVQASKSGELKFTQPPDEVAK